MCMYTFIYVYICMVYYVLGTECDGVTVIYLLYFPVNSESIPPAPPFLSPILSILTAVAKAGVDHYSFR